MLTVDLVRVRIKGGEISVVPLAGKQMERAAELAEALLASARGCAGRSREELGDAFAQIECAPRDRLLMMGLRKLVEDRCIFDVSSQVDPQALRGQAFLRAAQCRRESGEDIDRDAILGELAGASGLSREDVEKGMYADLRGAHLLREVQPTTSAELVAGYDMAQAQAVLLRAVRVVVHVRERSAARYRALFHKLKFLRLLYRITPLDNEYVIEIDGPYSLFESVTKYGLRLALMLPAVVRCERYTLDADVRWGRERTALRFHMEGEGAAGDGECVDTPALSDEVAALLDGFRALASPWKATARPALLNLPGIGLCVPDLLFTHPSGARVYLEVLGYWSRDAVWRRIELSEKGLKDPILFAVSERLRVSEQALPEGLPHSLYVYKGVMSPRAIEKRLDQLGIREHNRPGT